MKLLKELKELQSEITQVRKSILESLIIEGVDDPGILKCCFMAGGPGSGKGYTSKELFGIDKTFNASFASSGLKVVNSDAAFEKLLKDNGINPKDLAKIEREDPELWKKITEYPDGIRDKARKLTNQQKEFYESGRLGLILDGTGDKFEKIKNQKQHAESLGYDTFMVFVNTSLEVALERNAKRDRTLPDNLVKDIWNHVQENMGKFQQLFGSNNFIIVDNTIYGPPAADIRKAINRFVSVPVRNEIGRKWIYTARALKKSKLIKK
jgi:cytidylate kinase